jgi:hypothetical protein
VPAKTTEQLFATHSQYLDASASQQEDFRNALNEVMPRIYKLGYWREMLVEHTQDASDGYVSLPQDTDSIVAGILDDNPLPTRSLWHDYKLFGTNSQNDTLVNAFIDDGYAPTYRDLNSANQYRIKIATLKSPFTSSPTAGSFNIKCRQNSDITDASASLVGGETVLKGQSFTEIVADAPITGTADYNIGAVRDITEILSISWSELAEDHPIRIIGQYQGVAGTTPTDTSDKTNDILLAETASKSGVSRYRRFRVGGTDSTSSAHMLLKRKWVDVDSTSDLVHMPSNAILKHALLGKLAEDNADLQRAQYHWGTVSQLLESDTDSYRGAAKPTLHVAPNGVGGGMSGMY